MNPYLNSLNGFGGGFIAFWPSQGSQANLGETRTQDFEALQREQLLKDLNRNLKTADVNKMIKFSGSARISESSNVNRTSKLGSKRGKTTLKGKNRTLH